MDKTFLKFLDELEDEIDGAWGYAMEYKLHYKTHPTVADMYRQMSMAEMQHAEKILEMSHNYLSTLSNEKPEKEKMQILLDYNRDRTMKDIEKIKASMG
jgi:rubrerythrin